MYRKQQKNVHGCFTSDSDAFLFGARTVYRDVFIGDGGYVICYEMEDIEKKLHFDRKSLLCCNDLSFSS
uniref:XPG-I domain-containing protein n=2 Tax=Aegilops tauschii subsp. strangulata TaxID=200361 RepID=A0A453E980_AEGTS